MIKTQTDFKKTKKVIFIKINEKTTVKLINKIYTLFERKIISALSSLTFCVLKIYLPHVKQILIQPNYIKENIQFQVNHKPKIEPVHTSHSNFFFNNTAIQYKTSWKNRTILDKNLQNTVKS